MFRIEMLPAREGDCLWITYGDPAQPRHVLIDGGRKATAKETRARLQALGPAGRLELLVISHIDRDHIEGVLDLFDKGLGVAVGDIWFNAYHHLTGPELEPFGAAQGERLSIALKGKPWNEAFGKGRICITNGPQPAPPLAGGLKLTLLSPTPAKLADLRPVWKKECEAAGLAPGAAAKHDGAKPAGGLEIMGTPDVPALALTPFKPDGSEPNGSSIALLAEFEGKRVLLAADAHADVLIPALKALDGGAPVKLDAFKLAHHGSAANTSSELIELVECDRWLISTNGSYFKHPDQSAIARVIRTAKGKREIYFNYRTAFTEVWDSAVLMQKHGYKAIYPQKQGFQTLDL